MTEPCLEEREEEFSRWTRPAPGVGGRGAARAAGSSEQSSNEVRARASQGHRVTYLHLNVLGIDHFHNAYHVVKHKAKLLTVV